MRLHRRPFAGDDAVDAGVAQRAVATDMMVAQDAVELGAEALDGPAALHIEIVRAEFDRDAAQRLEGVVEQQQLALTIERGALQAAGIPCRADLEPAACRIGMKIV